MALTVEQRIQMACKVRDINFMHLDVFSGIFDAIGISTVGECKAADEIEDALRGLFIDILDIREILKDNENLNDAFVAKFYDSDTSNDDIIAMVEDFIE